MSPAPMPSPDVATLVPVLVCHSVSEGGSPSGGALARRTTRLVRRVGP